MRILHILEGTVTGGVPTVVHELSAYQKRQGNEVDIYSFKNEPSFFDNTGKFESLGINVIKAPSKNRYSFKIIIDLLIKLPKYDLVHVHLFPQQLYVGIASALLKRKKRPVIITTEHSTWNNRRKYPFLRILDRWFYNRYAKIVCISPQTEQALRDWLKDEVFEKRIFTINNGINLDKYREVTLEDCSDFKFQPNQKIVVMVSRMEEPKDPLTLVKAISLCPSNYHCVFVGSGELLKDIKSLATKLNLNHRIHCLGNRNDIPSILKSSDVGVLSTNWEGFGLVAIEYMASGLPCLVTDVEGLKDVVGDNELLFPKGDATTLSNKIQRIVEDPVYSKAKIEFGLARSNKFSANVMNHLYLNLYKELTKKE